MTTINPQPPKQLPKTPTERLTDVFTTARAVVGHCDTAPGEAKNRFAYSVDVWLVEELKAALKAVEKAEKKTEKKT